MLSLHPPARGVGLALLLTWLAPVTALSQEGLSSAEREAARAVADSQLSAAGPLAERRIFAVRVELFRDKALEERPEAARQALVTHYQYDGDLALLTFVDLRSRKVFRQDTIPHLPVPLSPEELAQARSLALAEPKVGETLRPYGERLVVEPLVIRTSDPDDPLAGQRVVRLLFRTGADYLRRPIVTVNLTTRRVEIAAEPR